MQFELHLYYPCTAVISEWNVISFCDAHQRKGFQKQGFSQLPICRPLAPLLRSDHIYMKDAHCAESNENLFSLDMWSHPLFFNCATVLWSAGLRHISYIITFIENYCNSVVLNLVGGTESHKFHTCIHQIFRSWKNKMCVINFIYFIFIAQNL